MGKMYDISSIDANATIVYIKPNLEKKELKYKKMLTPPRAGYAGYSTLAITSIKDNHTYSATRYIYSHGRPAPHTPRELLALQNSKLEIKPTPLSREHDRYKASNWYKFLVIYDKKILADTNVMLSTQNGTTKEYKTDSNGVLRVVLPNDFENVKPNRRANKPSEFSLEVSKENHTSTLTMPYSVNAQDYWQSRNEGFIAIVAGFILAIGGFMIGRKNG
jgi:hypothetical protein